MRKLYVVYALTFALSGCDAVFAPMWPPGVPNPKTVEALQKWRTCAEQAVYAVGKSESTAPASEIASDILSQCKAYEEPSRQAISSESGDSAVNSVVEGTRSQIIQGILLRVREARSRAHLMKNKQIRYGSLVESEIRECAGAQVNAFAKGNPWDPPEDLVKLVINNCYPLPQSRELLEAVGDSWPNQKDSLDASVLELIKRIEALQLEVRQQGVKRSPS